jgi:hypothetical protein
MISERDQGFGDTIRNSPCQPYPERRWKAPARWWRHIGCCRCGDVTPPRLRPPGGLDSTP